jgi:hypothetical protein
VPDISMCTATTCAVAGRCVRHPDSGTKPDTDQSWMAFEPAKGAGCPGFWATIKDSSLPIPDTQRGSSPAASPVIDDWQIVHVRNSTDGSVHNVAIGRVSGDSRWPDGRDIRTSTITETDVGRQWVRTRNTRYILGCPHSKMPLVVEVAMQPTWSAAMSLARERTGRHTLPDAIRAVADAAAYAVDTDLRRQRCAMVAEHLRRSGRDTVADAWQLLSVTDGTDTNAVNRVFDIMCQSIDSYQTSAASDVIDGWAMMSLGKTGGVDLTDPVAAARKLGAGYSEKGAREGLRERMEDDTDIPVTDEPRGVEPTSGVMVLVKVGGTTETSSGKEAVREFKTIAGRRLPMAHANGIAEARTALRAEFPHLWSAIDILFGDLREGEPVRLRPSLLVGAPGGGKSRMVRRIAHHIGVGLHRFDGAGSGDNAFGGTPRRWSTGEHCVPLEAVRRHTIANPIVMVDEVDKAAQRGNNGSLANALMPFLEAETAMAFPDPFVQSEVDLSHVSFILTCNDDTLLPAPLRDRLRVIRIPEPTLDHMIPLARGIVADLARENGGDERWYPDLDDGELAVVEGLWPGGSVRRLRAIVERIVARRETNPRN